MRTPRPILEQPWLERLRDERDDLCHRLGKLRGLLQIMESSPGAVNIDPEQERLLRIQADAMATLYRILCTRVELASK